MSEFAISADHTKIAYTRYDPPAGAAAGVPPVIFVAAAMQFRAFAPGTGELAAALAARGVSVLVYDRRGRGESEADEPYSLTKEIEDLRALVATAGGRAGLVGNSSGGAICLAAAAAGVPVSGIALWELPLDTELGPEGAEFVAGLRRHVAAGDAAATIEYYMRDMPPEWLARAKQSPAWPTMMAIGPTLVPDAEALAWTQSAPHAELLGDIDAPVLAMYGSETLPLFPEAAAAIVAAVPNGRTAVLAGRDHGWDREEMAETLAGFFAR